MPTNPYSRVLNGLRSPALLNKNDMWQQDYMTTPDPDQPADNMSGFRQRDPALQLDTFNRNMTSELRDRIFKNQRLSGYGTPQEQAQTSGEVDALKGLLSGYQQDIDTSRLARQGEQIRTTEDANQKAQLMGFDDAPSGARWERDWEQEKARIPLEIARQGQATAISQAEAQARGAIALERERAENDRQLLQGGAGEDLSRYSRSGSGRSYSWRNNLANSGDKPYSGYSTLLKGVRDANAWFGRAKGTGDEAAAQSALQEARDQLLANTNHVEPEIRDMVHVVVSTPGTENLNEDQIIQGIMEQYDTSGVTDAEWIKFKELLRMMR